jgi:hypothetical protein
MGTDALQHRESIGRFYCLARTVKNSKRLTLLEFIGIYLFVIHGIVALPITVFIFSFQYKYRVNLSGSTVQTSEQLVKSKSLEYVNNYAFLCIVMCILLIISGIEMNPGPSDSDLSSSFGSISSTSTTVSNFIHNSVSFLHLNIHSITPSQVCRLLLGGI